MHPIGESENEKSVRVVGSRLQPFLGHFASFAVGINECVVAVCGSLSFHAAEKLVVVQEKLGGEDALGVEFLVEVAGRFSRFAHRIAGLHFLIGEEMLARARKIQFVELAKSRFEEGFGRVGFDSDARLRGGYVLRAPATAAEKHQAPAVATWIANSFRRLHACLLLRIFSSNLQRATRDGDSTPSAHRVYCCVCQSIRLLAAWREYIRASVL